MPDYSFSPQFATIRSESPLAGMRPVEGLRHTALGFQPQRFLDIKSAQPELVSNALASGLKEGVGDALKGITAAFVNARKAKTEKDEKLAERENRLAIAKERAKTTTADDQYKEDYKNAQLENLRLQIAERKRLAEEKGEDGDFVQGDDINSSNMDAILDPLPEENTSEMWKLGLPDETEDVLNPLTSVGPTQQDVQALWNKPLSELTAEASPQKQLDQLTSTSLAPVSPPMSTDVVAGKAPVQPSVDINTRSMSLMTPQERSAIAEKFYAETGEMPFGMGALSQVTLPEKERQQVKQAEPSAEMDISNLFNDYAKLDTAIKSQKKIAEKFGPEYHEAEIESITKKGQKGFRVKFPKKKTDKELAEQNKGTGIDFDTERKLRDEYIGQTKDFKTIQSAWRSIKTSGKEPSAAGDMSLIFGYMKLLDPASTVREGEYANAQNAAGVPDRIRAFFNKAVDGQILAETQRKDFLNQAKKQYDSRLTEYNQLKESYSDLAKQYGLEPKRVIVDFNIAETIPESENLTNTARQLVSQIRSLPEGDQKESLKAQLREIQIKLKK